MTDKIENKIDTLFGLINDLKISLASRCAHEEEKINQNIEDIKSINTKIDEIVKQQEVFSRIVYIGVGVWMAVDFVLKLFFPKGILDLVNR